MNRRFCALIGLFILICYGFWYYFILNTIVIAQTRFNILFTTKMDRDSWVNYIGPIPPELFLLTRLTDLRLDDVKFEGTLPNEIELLTNLNKLRISVSRNLEGTIPLQIGKLSTLTKLNFCSTKISGEIPSQIGLLSGLKLLGVSYSFISGSIPLELFGLTSLETLLLSHNNLTSTIPSQFGKLTNLTSLYLESNDFIGFIPTEFGLLTALYAIDVSYMRQLGQTIPTEMINLNLLTWFDISYTQLSVESGEYFSGVCSLLTDCEETPIILDQCDCKFMNIDLEKYSLMPLVIPLHDDNSMVFGPLLVLVLCSTFGVVAFVYRSKNIENQSIYASESIALLSQEDGLTTLSNSVDQAQTYTFYISCGSFDYLIGKKIYQLLSKSHSVYISKEEQQQSSESIINAIKSSKVIIIIISESSLQNMSHREDILKRIVLEYEYALDQYDENKCEILLVFSGDSQEFNGQVKLVNEFISFNIEMFPEKLNDHDLSPQKYNIREVIKRITESTNVIHLRFGDLSLRTFENDVIKLLSNY